MGLSFRNKAFSIITLSGLFSLSLLFFQNCQGTFEVADASLTPQDVPLTDALFFLRSPEGEFGFRTAPDEAIHYMDRKADAVALQAGGQTWGYLLNPKKSTGWNVPQLYVHNAPSQSNIWGAPLLFNTHSNNGVNRSIGIRMSDHSTSGMLAVTGIEVQIDSPPDRGGDTSGIYVRQSGGGNALSIYKLSDSFPNNGFAIETRANGNAHTIWTAAQNGIALMAEVYGTGVGVGIFPDGNATSENRALTVFNSERNQEKFFITMGGSVFVSGDIRLSKFAGSGNAYACFDPDGKLFRSQSPCN